MTMWSCRPGGGRHDIDAHGRRRLGLQLDGRVFDNAEEAERVHVNPFVQNPPVAHIDRPFWFLSNRASHKKWDEAWKVERQIEKLARKFGGRFIGT
jgi:hypothetical protein